jgi:hypothetical protein
MALEDRRTSGPFASFEESRKRLVIAPHDLAAFVRAGCLDFTGRGRETLLAEAKLSSAGLPAAARKRPRPIPPWPLSWAGRGAGEWEMLGFACGPPLMARARRALPPGLADSRALRAASNREPLAVAGLVAGVEGDSLVLIDEYGTLDVDVTPGVAPPAEGELALAEGVADVRHGAAVLRAKRAEAWHPGAAPESRGEAA